MTPHELDELVRRWEAIVDEVARGYDLTLDDYLNDMDLRERIARALTDDATDPPGAPHHGRPRSARRDERTESRLAGADARFHELTVPTGPIWGAPVAADEGHDPAHQWWYFRRPANPGPELARDLADAKLLD
ncbi:MAG TPA: hypothetical protein VFW66_03385 [Gemmatimonadales bacterium]|nr:hypothetical protein [Gemmatimonadales bacterium]